MSLQHATDTRWFNLCERLGIDNVLAEKHFLTIKAQYDERADGYHNRDHIDYGLGLLDANRHLASYPDHNEFAWWNHDPIQLAQRRPRGFPCAEALCAVQTDNMLMQAGKPFEMRVGIHSRNMVTTHEEDKARNRDEMIIADIDWSPLAWPWEEYLANRARIRREYAHVSDADFQKGRIAWVAKMCRRQHHFYLHEFREAYEDQTQANLTRELREFHAL